MSWFRSSDMEYISIVINRQRARECMERLGDLGVMQFRDLQGDTTAFKRDFTDDVRVCDELELVLANFEKEMKTFGIQPDHLSVADFYDWRANEDNANASNSKAVHRPILEYWQERLQREHDEYQHITKARDENIRARAHAVEEEEVVERLAELFEVETNPGGIMNTGNAAMADDGSMALMGGGTPGFGEGKRASQQQQQQVGFQHVAGTIPRSQVRKFERRVVIASRRQAYVRFSEPQYELYNRRGEPEDRVVFAVFFHATAVAKRVRRVCSAYGSSLYTVPELGDPVTAHAAVSARQKEVRRHIEEQSDLLRRQEAQIKTMLARAARDLVHLKRGVRREKAIAIALNRLEPASDTMLKGEAWVIPAKRGMVEDAVRSAHLVQSTGAALPYFVNAVPKQHWGMPPTHFRTNKFTKIFQDVVDTYGVAMYKEVNPALFTTISFPFLFGVMYGDVGHASIIFVIAALAVIFEEQLMRAKLSDMFQMAFQGRYMILLMAFFGMYCGIVYNDLFGLNFYLFESRWYHPEVEGPNGTMVEQREAVRREVDGSSVYPFGVDPEWKRSQNELLFLNSMKMKMSVIIGIVHMFFGLTLRAANSIYFSNMAELFLEVVPMFVLFITFLGYIAFLILYKWSVNWYGPNSPGGPPNLIDLLIGILLKPGQVDEPMFEGQAAVHSLILAIVFICIPLILLGKPMALWRYHSQYHTSRALPGGYGASAPRHSDGAGALGGAEGGDTNSLFDEDEDEDQRASSLFAPVTSDGAAAGGGGGALMPPSAADEDDFLGGDDERTSLTGGGGDVGGHGGGHGHGGPFDFGDELMHQAIETIEFTLNLMSHTASYLRLWALSLAHTQLAAVFWEKALRGTIEMGSPIAVFIGFGVFAGVTFMVLCMMDVLECYLHTLRLHWVEFQTKFYKSDGYKFQPFSFQRIVDEPIDASM